MNAIRTNGKSDEYKLFRIESVVRYLRKEEHTHIRASNSNFTEIQHFMYTFRHFFSPHYYEQLKNKKTEKKTNEEKLIRVLHYHYHNPIVILLFSFPHFLMCRDISSQFILFA